MDNQEKNEMIARWMGWELTPGGILWRDQRGIGHFKLPDYSTDHKALSEVLERIRKDGHHIDLSGWESSEDCPDWTLGIYPNGKSVGDYLCRGWGPTEQAAKFEAVVQFVKSQMEE